MQRRFNYNSKLLWSLNGCQLAQYQLTGIFIFWEIVCNSLIIKIIKWIKTKVKFYIINYLLLLFSHYVLLCDPMDCSMPGFAVLHCLLEFAQTHVHWVCDAIQWSHPLSPLSPPALNLSQHPSLFQWVNSSHLVAKVLELQQQSFHWIFRVDFL